MDSDRPNRVSLCRLNGKLWITTLFTGSDRFTTHYTTDIRPYRETPQALEGAVFSHGITLPGEHFKNEIVAVGIATLRMSPNGLHSAYCRPRAARPGHAAGAAQTAVVKEETGCSVPARVAREKPGPPRMLANMRRKGVRLHAWPMSSKTWRAAPKKSPRPDRVGT
jgi:hypothetical protein